MSVKRYNLLAVEYYDGATCEEIESECGDWVLASDYDELRERVTRMLECNDMVWPMYRTTKYFEVYDIKQAARKAVEELL